MIGSPHRTKQQWRADAQPLPRVMKNDAKRVALAHPKRADAVAYVDTIEPARPLDRTIAIGEDDAFALIHRDRFAARLRARPLLDEQEFAALKIALAPAQHRCELERERDVAIQILMEAIVTAGLVAQ